jgi:hypothetical protein
MRRDLMVTALCLAILGLAFPARAEVRVVTDRHGVYKTTRVLQGGERTNVWSPVRRAGRAAALNLFGDRNGDLFPTIRESRVAPHYPWIVWSRFNRAQYDLAWSRWTDGAWEPVRWLEPSSSIPGDSLDADLRFDLSGRPYVVWWRNEGGVGRIYISVFLDGRRWMPSLAISEEGQDSRYPALEIETPDEAVVRYETEGGTVEQTVRFDLPDTITDDINPLDFVFTDGVLLDCEGD